MVVMAALEPEPRTCDEGQRQNRAQISKAPEISKQEHASEDQRREDAEQERTAAEVGSERCTPKD